MHIMKHGLPASKFRTVILSLTLLIIVGGISYRLGENHVFSKHEQGFTSKLNLLRNTDEPTKSVDFSLFWDVWARLQRYYIDAEHIDTQNMVYGAINGMVASLDDPYTSFLPPKENKEFKEDIGGEFEGIGAQLGLKENAIIVIAPLKGTPAEKAGIRAGDYILKVDGEETTGWTTTQAVAKIRGQKGTKVTLTILHEKAQKTEDITIIRDGIVVPSVDFWMKAPSSLTEISGTTSSARLANDQIAYIALSRFGDKTNDEWLTAVDTVAKAWANKSIRGLVFDLRNNPGGYLDGSVFIASEFIKSGKVVTQTNSDGSKQEYMVDRKGKLTDIPLVILVNKGSASASEIVAGALKDYKRGTLVGETSFGKGSVQSPQELTGGSSLHVTTGKWLLPNGDWIHKKGITPDITVASDSLEATRDAQLGKAIEVLLK